MIRRRIFFLISLPALLLVLGVSAWTWLWHSESGTKWLWQAAREQLIARSPDARLDGRVSGTLAGGLVVQSFIYSDSALEIRAKRVELAGSVDLFPVTLLVHQLDLHQAQLQIADSQQADRPERKTYSALNVPFPVLIESLRIDQATFIRADTVVPIDQISARASIGKTLKLHVDSLHTPALSGTLELKSNLAPPFETDSRLGIGRFTLPPAERSKLPWLPEKLSAAVIVKGNIHAVEVEGSIQWPDWMPQAKLTGHIEQPLDQQRWNLNITLPHAELPADWIDWQSARTLAGQPYTLALADLDLSAGGEKENYEFNGTAGLVTPWTRNTTVEFEGEGAGNSLERWTTQGAGEIGVSDWPQEQFDFDASFAEERFRAELSAAKLFGGSLFFSASTQRESSMPWEARLTTRSVASDPLIRALLPHFNEDVGMRLGATNEAVRSENIDANINATGTFKPFRLVANIEQLLATVRGRRISAVGQVEFDSSGVLAKGLSIQSGESRFVLDGSPAAPEGLEVGVSIASLDDIFPNVSGELEGIMLFRSDPDTGFAGSRMQADLEGRNIEAAGWSISALEVTGEAPAAVSVLASGISSPIGSISSASAALNGTFNATTESWTGSLDQFEVAPEIGPAWSLTESSAATIGDTIAFEDLCLSTTDNSVVCIDIERARDGAFSGQLKVESFSADTLGPGTRRPLKFSQMIDGAVSWNQSAGQKPSARGEFTVSEGVIIDRSSSAELLRTDDGRLRFSLVQGRLDSGNFHLPIDGGSIDVDFSLSDVMAGVDSDLRGSIDLEMDNLEALASFMPQLVQSDGRLRINTHVAGSLGDPQLSGEFALSDGHLQFLTTGLDLRDINLKGSVRDSSSVDLEGAFLAGEGRGELDASIILDDPLRPVFDLAVRGEGLTLIDVPDIQLRADTDLNAGWDGQELRLTGTIHVPFARFLPRIQPSDIAIESPDVVIVAGGEDVSSPPESSNWRLAGEVQVSMGDDVLVDLGLARATMQGSTRFTWSGPSIPLASGEYNLEGEVEAYGQNLEITRATIRFPNVPADNPHLDIRGERRIYGNSLISHAGVLIHGTLKRPVTEAYTIPPTNADRARTLLITGSDFNYEQGVGAVSVGKYISPKLYLSYGVGLFEEGNIITVRYDLKRNFGIKATSGQDDTGIDISYTIEK